MEFSAISPSNSLHFPTNFLEKIMTHFMVRPRNATFSCRTLQIQTLASNLEESSRVSFSTRSRADIKNEESLVLGNRKGWIHFVGIGGSGLSALAMLALKQGFEVSGSDIVWSSFMDGLKEAGAQLHLGHSESNIQRNNGSSLPDAIVVSSAIPQDNLEILHAKSVGIPVYKRANWLGKLTEHYNLIAVSGTHGKSTTASMLAYVLKSMGDDLTAVVGAQVPQFGGGNIMSGSGRNFVLEADEYDCCFLGLLPYIAVVTNVDWEHVDIFPDEEAVKAIFRRFLKQIRVGGHLILCGDRQCSAGACSLLDDREESTVADHSSGKLSTLNSDKCSDGYRITTFGISRTNEWHALSIRPNSQGGSDFVLVIATVMALVSDGRQSYESINCVKIHLNNFVGVSRRFELIGTVCGCHIYDDYAHHPTEVRAVLQAARQRFPLKALLVVFQPHTYSRLAALKSDFATAFSDADQVLVTEIYAARETNVWNVSGKDLATSIIGPPSEYIPSLGDVVDKLAHQISLEPDRETVVFTLGAGDITTVGSKLFHELQGRLQK
ncbi:UDP-N-acetylmuramate--L-alanine ligase-like isoform X3 [Vitis riparia]|uniref:UDP-N-acetylmuramate--L-alanine ligase-like isoform X3 n=1 Tax=Vitis riparia TaxID=96939 RepID=UPI00155A3BE8|nr:UDP-N-acetylmuramate--L-alanine ligase-like isoform X3 [Vitis riparia]